ncbi:PREDICTED: histone H3.3-like [Nicrophorus vespilloides]|uniref:Histone H3.3-like n=1 Tax=Nicrophorus vespilloides TaxID=110193 RepID=A0ABM1NKF4_NICVS|nr:PREDICTED: histone H3.3-like [Nicrophorus vespilloides]
MQMTEASRSSCSPKASGSKEKTRLSKSFKKKKSNKKYVITQAGVAQTMSANLIKEMKKLQLSVEDLIPKMTFCRLIKEIMQKYGEYRIQGQALQGLQTAAEMYMVQMFEDSNKCTMHARRATLQPPDMQLVLNIRSRYDVVATDSLL